MKMCVTCKRLFAFSLLSALATAFCMRFIDEKIALTTWKHTLAHPELIAQINRIPNALPALVVAATIALWLSFCLDPRRKGSDRRSGFILLAAISVPLAYLTKTFLQFAFGRTNIRLWLRVGGPVEFSWFAPVEGGGFPSGHALVITAFFTAVWICFPRWRPLAAAAVASLAAALVLTSYHFASDVIAGVCCGVVITAGVQHTLSR